MITQYTESYSTPSTQVQNIVANSVSILDQYVLIQTGQYEYTALIKNIANGDIEKITIARENNGSYNSIYNVVRDTVDSFDYQITNEYYAISNVGKGQALQDIPSQSGIISFALTGLVTLVFFAVIFKGALFKCLKPKK
jgi:hypothetical protein